MHHVKYPHNFFNSIWIICMDLIKFKTRCIRRISSCLALKNTQSISYQKNYWAFLPLFQNLFEKILYLHKDVIMFQNIKIFYKNIFMLVKNFFKKILKHGKKDQWFFQFGYQSRICLKLNNYQFVEYNELQFS